MGGFQLKPLVASLRCEPVLPAGHWMRLAVGALLAGGATSALAAGSNIEAAAGFGTTVSTTGNTHKIENGLMKGSVAVNGFNHFVVGNGDTAQLMLPNNASKLVNLVRDRVEVHGLLESYQNGSLGGDVLFASSQGFLVGPSGVVNVGKLTVTTPNGDYMNQALTAGSGITQGQLDALQDGSLAVSSSGLVRIEGKVVTAEGTEINANQVQVASGAYLINGNAKAAIYQSAVNVGDATASRQLQQDGGTLVITAAGENLDSADFAVDVDGNAWADGGIEISAPTILVGKNATLDTRNGTTSDANNVVLAATSSTVADPTDVLGGAAFAHAEVIVDGHIIGADVSATAKAEVTAEYTADNAEACKASGSGSGNQVDGCWLSVSNPLEMGLPLNNLEAHASAAVKVNGTIDASGDVTLAAETKTHVATSGIGKIGEDDDKVLYAAPFVYGAIDAQSQVEVSSAAAVNASGDLTLSAFNDATLDIKANAAPAVEGEDYSDQIVLAFGKADITADATIAGGASVQANNVVITAENQSSLGVSAKAPSGALAFGLFNTSANALLAAGLGSVSTPMAGDVLVLALDRITKQDVSSESEAEKAEDFYTVGSLSIGAVSQAKQRVQSLIEQYAGDAADDMAKDEDKPNADDSNPNGQGGGLTWQAGVAVSLNISSHDATARIANSAAGLPAPHVITNGQVGVIAQTETQGLKTQSTSTASIEKEKDDDNSGNGGAGGTGGGSNDDGTGIAVSIATNVTVRDSQAIAEVGDYVRIDAKNVGVAAEQNTLINNPWSEWDSLVDIVKGLKESKDDNFGVDDVVTSFANAQAGGDEADYAFGGAFNVQLVSHDTKAWINDGAHITTTGGDQWSTDHELKSTVEATDDNPDGKLNLNHQWDAATAVVAHNVTQSVNLNGNMGDYLVKPGNSASEGNAIGGTVAYVQWDGSAVAGVGAALIETDAGNLGVNAQTEDLQVLITPSSGEGKGVAFSGALAILNVSDYTSASLSNQAQVVADKVEISATQVLSHWAAAGALAMSNETAIGAGAAVVISDGDTRAYIGDNSDDAVRIVAADAVSVAGTSPIVNAGIISREVQVVAQSSGMVGALAAAGAVAQEEKAPKPEAETKKEPGLVDKFKDFIKDPGEGLINAFTGASEGDESDDTSIAGATKDGKTGDSAASAPGAASTDPLKSAGLSAAGAFTVAVADINVESFIDGATIGAPSTDPVDVIVQALNKTLDISASGAAALVMNKKPQSDTSAALAGAIAYQISHNDTIARIKDSIITQAGDVSVNALSGGERVSVGLGVSGNTSSGSGQSISAAVSLSAAQVADQTSATIEGSDVTAAANKGDVVVNAYNNTDIGVGGGSVYAGGKTGMGLAVTFATIGNPDSGDAIYAAINNSRIRDVEQVIVTASNISRIVLAAAGVGVQSADSGPTISVGGSFAIGDISTRTRALVTGGSEISATGLAVNAIGTKNNAYDQVLKDIGTSDANDDFDFSGSSAYSKTGTHTSEDDAGDQVSYDAEGERIITVAGQVNVALGSSGGAGGIAYSHADIHTKREARIENAHVTIAGDADVNARNDALIYNFAIGAAVSQGSFSGVGSVTTSRINNQVIAEVGNWNGASNTYVNANTLGVNADNHAQIISLAGGVALNLGSGAAAGLAASVNLVGDRGGENGHITRARAGNAELDVNSLVVDAQSGSTSQRNQIIGNAIGVGISSGGLAFAGAVDVNNIDQKVEAGVKAIGGQGANGSGVLKVDAADNTYSVGTAWTIAGSGGGPAVGVAVVVNRVVGNVVAELLGGGNAVYQVNDASVRAYRNLELLTLDAGVAVSDSVAISPSVGTALTGGAVNARIADSAVLVAQNNVQVTADSDLLSHAASGALGVGVEGGAGAIAVSTVLDNTTTAAYIDNASVSALGLGNSVQVNSGTLSGSANLAELSDKDQNLDRKDIEQGFTTHYQKESKTNATGLIVNATSYNRMMAVEVAGAGGLGAGIAVNAATHAFNGDTQAYINNSQINQGQTLGSKADVLVRAGAHNSAMGITAGIAGSAGASAVAGLVLNLEDHDTKAYIANSTLNAHTLNLSANATSLMQGVAVGVGVGSFGGAASVVTNKLDGDTTAQLTGGVTTADTINVTATKSEQSNAATGSAGIGVGVGLGVGLIANLGDGNTRALVGDYAANGTVASTPNTIVNVGDLAVNAVRTESIQSYAFGMGVDASFAGAGIAGMLNLSDTTGETRAGVYAAQVRGKAGGNSRANSVTINATESFKAEQHAAALGVGGVGIGAAFNVVLNLTQTIAELVNSDTRANTLSVEASSDNDTFITSVAGGAGGFGGAISLGYIRQGSGSGGDALGELQGNLSNTNDILGAGSAATNNHTLSASERDQLNNQSKGSVDVASTETGVNAGALQPVDGTALVLKGAKVTAARVSGGTININDLVVNSEGRTHAQILSGGVAAGLVGVSGGLGVIRNYNQNIALVDAAVTAKNISVNAVEKDGANGAAADLVAFTGAAGGIAIGVAVSDAQVNNRVLAGVTQAVGDSTGNLDVHAEDSTSVRVGGDEEDAPTNVTVALASVALSHASATKSSDVSTLLGGAGRTVSGFKTIDADAQVNGLVRSTAFTASASYFGSAQGVITRATDNSTATVNLAGTIGVDEALLVDSDATAQTYARSFGISVAAGVGIGVSDAKATANTSSSVLVADNTVFEGGDSSYFDLTANTGQKAGNANADARAYAASGGVLAGVAGAMAESNNNSKSLVKVGKNVTLPQGYFSAHANTDTVQYSDSSELSVGGVLAVGVNTSQSSSDATSKVDVGAGLKMADPMVARLGDLIFKATGSTLNQALATASGGGAISGSAVKTTTNTSGGSLVSLAGWSKNAEPVGAGHLQLISSYYTDLQANTNSVKAAVLGLSGANAENTVNTYAKVDVGDDVGFVAGDVRVLADNQADLQSSTESGSGGVINGASANSKQTVTLNANVLMGNGILLSVLPGIVLDELGNNLFIDASARYDILDRAQMTSGGAIQVGGAKSILTITSNDTVNIGDGAQLENKVGKVGIGAQARGNANSGASVSLYGASGLANADALVDVTHNHKVVLGDNTVILSMSDVEIYAGRSADHITSAALAATANADVYNSTAFPLQTDPKASAKATTNSLVKVGKNVTIGSVLDVWMDSTQGNQYASGASRGRDLYDGVFSKERKGGESVTAGEGVIEFGDNSIITAGIYSKQSVSIDKDGNIDASQCADCYVGVLENVTIFQSLADKVQELLDERADLSEKAPTGPGTFVDKLDDNNNPVPLLEMQYVLDGNGDKIPLPDIEGEPQLDENGQQRYEMAELPVFLMDFALDDNGDKIPLPDINDEPQLDENGEQLYEMVSVPVYEQVYLEQPESEWAIPVDNLTRLQEVDELLAVLQPQLKDYTDIPGDAVWIANVTASGGDVHMEADRISVSGSTQVKANGDPKIQVTNKSGMSLIVENLGIVRSGGGQVLVTGAAADSLPSGLTLTANTENAGSLIKIDHDPDVGNYSGLMAPTNVLAQGLISNLGGTVDFNVARGNMLQTGMIEARQMNINVPNGTYSLDTNSYQSFGFNPTALRGFAFDTGLRPTTASSLVDWWINAEYSSQFRSLGEQGFNNWWYGVKANDKNYNDGNRIVSRTMHVYQNWGFSNANDCSPSSSSCHVIYMRNKSEKDGGSDRGSDYWGFDKIASVQDRLDVTRTYEQVSATGYGIGGTTRARKIYINAAYVDINGTLRAGQQNQQSVTVASYFDDAIADYIAAMGLGVGDTVRLDGNDLVVQEWVQDPVFGFSYLSTRYIDTGISRSGDSIRLIYDIGTKQLRMDDIAAAGGGYVSIRGKILSSSPNGQILLDDGYGNISITNNSQTQLLVNGIDTGVDNIGVVRIQDLNAGKSGVEWYIHTPGDDKGVQQYHSTNTADVTWENATLVTSTGTSSGIYEVKKGQVYRWEEQARVERSYTPPSGPNSGLYALFPNTVGEWEFVNSRNPELAWTIVSSGVISNGCGYYAACSNGEVSDYFHQTIAAGSITKSSRRLGFSFEPYYGKAFLGSWRFEIPTAMTLKAVTTIKADHNIAINFEGPATGSVNINSKGNVILNGLVNNSQGQTTINTDKDVSTGVRGQVDSHSITLNAKGNIGTLNNPLYLISNNVSVTGGGLVNIDLTGQAAQPGSISARLLTSGDLYVNAGRGLVAKGAGVQLSGANVNIVSAGGVTGYTTDITQVLNLTAQGDVELTQKTGDLLVGQVDGTGNVSLTTLNGGLHNAQYVGYTDEQLAYLADIWDALNLNDKATAGQSSVESYQNNVNSQYQQLASLREALANPMQGDAAQREAMEQRLSTIEAFFAEQFAEGNLAADMAQQPYDSSWHFFVLPGSALHERLVKGAYWSNSALLLAINSSALDASQTGNLSDRPANVTGRNVTLVAQGGPSSASVGTDLANAEYVVSKLDPDAGITEALKADLLRAGPGDVTLCDGDKMSACADPGLMADPGTFKISIRRQDPFKVNANGDLLVNAAGQIYLQSDNGANLTGLHAGKDVRVNFGGAITNGTSSTTISGDSLQLVTNEGSIGTAANPLVVDMRGTLLSAVAPSNVYLTSVADHLDLGQVSAGGAFALTSYSAIHNWLGNESTYNVKADAITLIAQDNQGAQYDLGVADRALRLEIGDGELSLVGDNAWFELNDGDNKLADVNLLGNLNFDTQGNVQLTGDMSLGGELHLSASDLTALEDTSATIGGIATINANEIDLAKWQLTGLDDVAITSAGNALLGNTSVAGNATLTASDQLHLVDDVLVQGDLSAHAQDIMLAATRYLRAADTELTATHAVNFGASSQVTTADLDVLAQSMALGQGQVLTAADTQFVIADGVSVLDSASMQLASLDANVGDWSMVTDAVLNVLGLVSINTTQGELVLGQVTGGANANLVSTKGLLFQSDATVGGNLQVNAADDLVLDDAVAVAVGGDAQLTGGSLAMGANTSVVANNKLSIDVINDMLVSYLATHFGGDNALVLNSAAGQILGRADSNLHVYASDENAKGYLTAAMGIGDPLVMDVPWLSAKTTQGDINLVSNRDLHASLLDASNGTVTIDNNGNLHIDDEFGSFFAQVEGLLTADRMTFDQAQIDAQDGVDVEHVTMTGTGLIDVNAPNIDFALIDVSGLPALNLNLTGINGAQSNWVGATIVNTPQVNVSNLQTVNGALTLPTNLSVVNASVRDRLDVTTDALTLRVDNAHTQAQNVDGQLVTPYGAFWAELAGTRLETNALVSRYRLPLLVSYAGQNKEADFSSNVAFYGISGQIVQSSSTQDSNVGARNHAPRWFEQVLNFISVGHGVSQESDTADAVQQDEDQADDNDYSIEISYRL